MYKQHVPVDMVGGCFCLGHKLGTCWSKKSTSAIRSPLYWYLFSTLHSRFKPGWFVDRFGCDFQIIFWSWMKNFTTGTTVSHLSRHAVWKPNLTFVSRTLRPRTNYRRLLITRLSWLHIRFAPSALPVRQGRKLASPSNPTLLRAGRACDAQTLMRMSSIQVLVPFICWAQSLSSI